MKSKTIVVLLLLCQVANAQTLSETQMRNARATGYAIVAARNPGVPFSIYMLEWDGINTLEHNTTTRLNPAWHAQAVIKGNFFYQEFDGSDFSQYSSVILSQEEFDIYKHTGTQWWIVCSTLPPFSNSITSQNGNVGIGINSPIHKLDVNGTTNFRGSLVLNDNALYLTTGGDYLSGIVGSGNTNLYTRGQLVLSSNGNNIGQQLLLQNNGVTALAIVPGGNIGIGTTTPHTKLQVKGHEGSNQFNPQEDLLHVGGNELGAYGGYAGIRIGGTSDGRYFTSIRSVKTNFYGGFWNNALTFNIVNTNTENSVSEAMRITSDGFVGVGTTTPPDRLSVNGNVRAKKLIVSQTNWPDYVFDPTYKLKPLSELAAFIQKNQHLPDIPSAKEVEEKGISVGDNQALLLKKIEELTLYVIDLQKQIHQLKNKNQDK